MKRWVLTILFCTVFAGFGLAGPAQSGELVEKFSKGCINWAQRVIRANGTGNPSADSANSSAARQRALRNARRSAYQNLLQTAKAMQLSEAKTVAQYAGNRDEVLSKVEEMLKNARVEATRYRSDGTVEVVREMPLGGAFSQLLLPDAIVQLDMKKMGDETREADSPVYTGLVVDARGVAIKPALCFKIFDENRHEVYGPAYVSREYAVQRGVCEYRTEISDIEESKRVGDNPLIVKALKPLAPGSPHIVVSNTDAGRLRGTVDHLFLLRKCRVMVIADRQAAEE
ncbi:MAG: hypothetical protein ACQERN_00785 [Thermodesulfobacteriota bacterium]